MEKLYQQDPFLTRFTAQVVSCAADKGGWSVVLDRTAFYPEGGGQPWDTGTLNGIPVTQVQEQDGAVVHTCAARLEPGTQVEGAVDWARRFDLMQQHSGEHIVSGLIHSTYGYDNVGFHLGSDLVTIDFNGPLEEEDLRDIELRANQYIWEDRPRIGHLPHDEGAGCAGLSEQKGDLWAGPHCLLPWGGHLRLLRDPCGIRRAGGAGQASLRTEVPGGRAGGAALRRPGP